MENLVKNVFLKSCAAGRCKTWFYLLFNNLFKNSLHTASTNWHFYRTSYGGKSKSRLSSISGTISATFGKGGGGGSDNNKYLAGGGHPPPPPPPPPQPHHYQQMPQQHSNTSSSYQLNNNNHRHPHNSTSTYQQQINNNQVCSINKFWGDQELFGG